MKKRIVSSFILILLTLVVFTFWITTTEAAPPKPYSSTIWSGQTNSIALRPYDFFDVFGILNKFQLTAITPNYTPVEGTFDQYYDNYFTPTAVSLWVKGEFNADLQLAQKLWGARISFTIDDINYYAGEEKISLLIMFESDDLDYSEISSVVSGAGGELNKIIHLIPVISVSVGRNNLTLLTTAMRSNFDIKSISVNSRVSIDLDESVPMIFEPGTEKGQRQWIEEKWAHGPIDGTGVIIAILDTGIKSFHPDLNDLDDNPSTYDTKVTFSKRTAYLGSLNDGNGHGTHCASIAAGTGEASDGKYTGVAPGANLYNIKVLDDEGQTEQVTVIEGIDWAISGPDGIFPGESGDTKDAADIINMSLSSQEFPYTYSDELVEAAERAVSYGVVVVISAGNFGLRGYSTVGTPGRAPSAITVASNTKGGFMAPDSSKGPVSTSIYLEHYETPYVAKPDVTAPGVNICAVKVIGGYFDETHKYKNICDSEEYGALSGTSMSAPHVAGTAALILQMHPDWTPAQVKSAIVQIAHPLENSEGDKYDVFTQGAGLVVVGDSLRFGGEVIPPVINAGVYNSNNHQLPIRIDFQGFNYNQNEKCFGLKIDLIKTKYIETEEYIEDLWDFPTDNMQLNAMDNINFHIERALSDLLPGRYATRFELDYYEFCNFSLPEPTKVLQIPIGFFVK